MKRPLLVHIPRTGGTSIRSAIGREKMASWRHLPADELRSHVGEEAWAAGFKFSLVRNPFDRFVSHYFFNWNHHRGKRRPRRAKFRAYGLGFTEWIRVVIRDEMPGEPILYNESTRRPLVEWVGQGLDFVGRFEALGEAFESICRGLEMPVCPLPHIHKTERLGYRHYYDDVTRKLIEQHYREDLETFGYGF